MKIISEINVAGNISRCKLKGALITNMEMIQTFEWKIIIYGTNFPGRNGFYNY